MIRRYASSKSSGIPKWSRGIVIKSSRKSVLPEIETNKLTHLTNLVIRPPTDFKKNAIAFIEGETGTSLTFEDNYSNIIELQNILRTEFQVGPGCVVCIFSPNSIYYASLWHAVLSLGATASTVSMMATSVELQRQIEIGKASCVITIPALQSVAKEALALCAKTQSAKLFVFTSDVLRSASAKHKGKTLEVVWRGNSPKTDGHASVCALPFSSGTTGLPKGVQLTHYSLLANVLQLKEAEQLQEGDVALAVLPYFHIYGLTVVMNLGLYVGTTQVVLHKFDVNVYAKCIEQFKATHLYIAPPIAIALAKNPEVRKYNRLSVTKIKSGAAPLGSEVQSEVIKLFPNAQVRQGYGLTETSPVTHLQPHGCNVTGSIGKLLSDTEARVVKLDGSKEDVHGPGEEGELWMRGPQVMLGYLNKSDTDQVMVAAQDGLGDWFKTGDIAKYDENNYFYITDRLKELIKVKGYQVAPAELEAVLLGHPDIDDVVVIGIPHEFAGEVPKAHVRLKRGIPETPEKAQDIIDFVVKSGKLAAYKRLEGGIRFVDSIPKSASGKLLRRMSRDLEAKYTT